MCLLALVETGALVYQRLSPPHPGVFEFRAACPAPYQDAEYFSPEFVRESAAQPGGWQHPEGTRLIIPNDYHGEYFCVTNGLRVTRGQPSDYEHVVYFFGGSTVYCSEVPDEHTLPSYLQKCFNRAYGSRFKVQNYGTTTVTTSQQLERLRAVKPAPGDIVVFYDGVNDIFQGVYHANPDETLIERNRRVIEEMSCLQRQLIRLASHSCFVRLCANPAKAKTPSHLRDPKALKDLLVSLRERYASRLIAAHRYAADHGSRFFHFLQPNLYTVKKPSAYERGVLANPNLFAPPGMAQAFRRGYPVLREVNSMLRDDLGLDCHDLSYALEREAGVYDEYYLDICHVNHAANRVIAQRIFRKIQARLDRQVSTPRP